MITEKRMIQILEFTMVLCELSDYILDPFSRLQGNDIDGWRGSVRAEKDNWYGIWYFTRKISNWSWIPSNIFLTWDEKELIWRSPPAWGRGLKPLGSIKQYSL